VNTARYFNIAYGFPKPPCGEDNRAP